MAGGHKIQLTRHVMEQMAKRGIGVSVMRETLRNPDSIELGYDGRKLAVKAFGNYTYVVTCEPASLPMRVWGTLLW